MKYSLSTRPKSNTETRLPCENDTCVFASSKNIRSRCGLALIRASTRLITSCFSNPSGPVERARNTSAIPPFPIGRKRS